MRTHICAVALVLALIPLGHIEGAACDWVGIDVGHSFSSIGIWKKDQFFALGPDEGVRRPFTPGAGGAVGR